MSGDTARLTIRVDTTGVREANNDLGNLDSNAKKAEGATSGLMNAFKGLVGPILAVVSATEGLTKIIEVQREFDKLNSGLITATKSSENAAIAFEALQQFAAKTPYDLAQAVEGFTKLVNLGLTPSEKAMMSYGNTASAMGKDLNDMIEAVADAATGEFERLKEFGIKSSVEGNKVTMTFQGIKTEIGNNAAEIEKYLMDLGENQFAGAMATRMATLDGAIANLGDTWDALFLNISKSGVGELIAKSVRMATDELQELSDMFASGQVNAYLDASLVGWVKWGEGIQQTIESLSKFVDTEFDGWGKLAENSGIKMELGFATFPTEIKAYFEEAAVEVAARIQNMVLQAQRAQDSIAAIFSDDTIDKATARYQAGVAANNQNYDESIAAIRAEKDADLENINARIDAGAKLREEWQKQRDARAAEGGDRLAGFKVGGGKPDVAVDKEAAAKAKKQKAEFDSVVAGLRSEEEAIQDSYNKRLAIIEANTRAGSTAREDLVKRLDADRAEDLEKYKTQKSAEFTALKESLLSEEEALNASYVKRMDIILANTEAGTIAQEELKKKLQEQYSEEIMGDPEKNADTFQEKVDLVNTEFEARRQAIMDNVRLTEEQRTLLETQLTTQRNQKLQALESARMSSILSTGAQTFDALAGLAKTFGGEQSKAYKVMFAASKAFAIADAIIKIQQGIANAAALPWPANLGAIASTVAATSSVLGTISSTNFAGNFDEGGNIPAGQFGIVGEYGPEVVNGPANVTSRKKTADLLGESGSGLTLVINNEINMSGNNGGEGGDDLETRLTAVLNQASEKTQSDILTSIRENGMWAKVMG